MKAKDGRGKDLLHWIFTALFFAALAPIWLVKSLPLIDLQADLTAALAWPKSLWTPPSIYLALLHVTGLVGAKLVLTANALLLPGAIVRLTERFDRSRWLCLFAFPLIWSAPMAWGAIPFLFAITLCLHSLASLDQFLVEGRSIDLVAFGLLGTLSLMLSVDPWTFWVLGSLSFCLIHLKNHRRVLSAIALIVPSVVLSLVFELSSSLELDQTMEALAKIPLNLLVSWNGNFAAKCLLGLACAWLALLWSARFSLKSSIQVEVLFVIAALLMLVVPHGPDAHQNVMPLVALIGVLLPRGSIAGRRALWPAVVTVISLIYAPTLSRHWHIFDKKLTALEHTLHSVPSGASVLTVVSAKENDPLVHLDAYVRQRRHDLGSVIGVEGFDSERRFDQFDYILTYGELRRHSVFGPDDAPSFPVVSETADLRLYRVVKHGD